jgi:hypothetical protein
MIRRLFLALCSAFVVASASPALAQEITERPIEGFAHAKVFMARTLNP